MALQEISSDFFTSDQVIKFPLSEHTENSMTVKRQVSKRFEYVHAIVNKLDNIHLVSHDFFFKFRKAMIKQYRFYCSTVLLEFGYQRKYYDFLYDFMCETFSIPNCVDYYCLFQGRRTKIMVVIYFLRHILQRLRSVLRSRIMSSLQSEE